MFQTTTADKVLDRLYVRSALKVQLPETVGVQLAMRSSGQVAAAASDVGAAFRQRPASQQIPAAGRNLAARPAAGAAAAAAASAVPPLLLPAAGSVCCAELPQAIVVRDSEKAASRDQISEG